MSSQTDLLKNLRIASPCHIGWERMTGNDRVRFCDSCQLNVYNFSEMTSREVESLVTKNEGRICGRMYRRADGTILTRDCPVGLRAVRRHLSRTAGAVLATLLSFCSVVFSQSGKEKSNACQEIQTLKLERKKADSDMSRFTGIIIDANRSLITNAEVILLTESGIKLRETKSDETGNFSFEGLSDGVYSLKISSTGFKTMGVKTIEIKTAEVIRSEIVLTFDLLMWTGIVSISPVIEPVNGNTKVIQGDVLRKLPINN